MDSTSIGKILKENRDKKGLSLKSVHQDTRISISYLEALESGEWIKIPAEIYVTGFLRTYSAYLGLDPETILNQYQKKSKKSNQTPQSMKKITSSNPSQKNEKKWGLLFLVLVFSIWVGLWKTMVKTPQHLSNSSVSVRTIPIKNSLTPTDALQLKIKAIDWVWLRIASDQELLFEGFLTSGVTREWKSNKEIFARIGNVHAVEVSMNGKPIDVTIGANQGVNDLHWGPEKNESRK